MADALNDRDYLLLTDKSFDLLMEESLAELSSTPISYEGAGSVAKKIIAAVNKHVADFYGVLKIQHAQAFVSKAVDAYLDSIGQMLNCPRNEGEVDDDYRYRISQQTLSAAKANETAIRLAALSVPGVKEVVLREFTHGAGSFSVYVVTDSATPSAAILEAVDAAVEEVKTFGVRSAVFAPKKVAIQFRARLAFNPKTSEFDKNILRSQATQAVRNYIGTMQPGSTFQMSLAREMVLSISDQITGMDIYVFSINNKPALLVNQTSAWNARFIEAEIPNAIIIS